MIGIQIEIKNCCKQLVNISGKQRVIQEFDFYQTLSFNEKVNNSDVDRKRVGFLRFPGSASKFMPKEDFVNSR